MTQQSLITRLKAVEEALASVNVWNVRDCDGDWFQQCSVDSEKIAASLSDIRELIKEAALDSASESNAYQQWLSKNGEHTRLGVASFGWLAWSAALAKIKEASNGTV